MISGANCVTNFEGRSSSQENSIHLKNPEFCEGETEFIAHHLGFVRGHAYRRSLIKKYRVGRGGGFIGRD